MWPIKCLFSAFEVHNSTTVYPSDKARLHMLGRDNQRSDPFLLASLSTRLSGRVVSIVLPLPNNKMM